MSISTKELKAIILAPVVTGCVSLTASLTIIIMIWRSNVKLSTTYRRLIFGVSCFDLFQSISQATSTLPMPDGMVWGAVGNDITCNLQGFVTVLGGAGSILYSLSISLYFLLVIKFNVSNERIKQRYEPFLHAVPIAYSLTVAVWIYVTETYNPAGTVCWISDEPPNCDIDPDVDCITSHSKIKKWLAGGAPFLGVFVVNCSIFIVLWLTEYNNFRRNQQHRLSFITAPATPNNNQDEEEGEDGATGCLARCSKINCFSRPSSTLIQNVNPSPLAARFSQPSNAAIKRRRSITKRGLAFIIGFVLTYIFSFIYRALDGYGKPVPFAVIFLTRVFTPSQGFFNVMIYSYPHVLNKRLVNPGYSWFKAFWEVVKSGGDNDQVPISRRSRKRRSSAAAGRRLTFPLQHEVSRRDTSPQK